MKILFLVWLPLLCGGCFNFHLDFGDAKFFSDHDAGCFLCGPPPRDPALCHDGVRNGAETDIDCGGNPGFCVFCTRNGCGPCRDGRTCTQNEDCESIHCAAGVCVAPTCDDFLWNGDEKDVDCGGSCAPCGARAWCDKDADCVSQRCVGWHCQGPDADMRAPIVDAGSPEGGG